MVVGELLRVGVLCGGGAAPERSGVRAVRVEIDHRVEQLACGAGRLVETDEVAKVLPGLGDVSWIVPVFWDLVPGDYGAWLKGV
jgi:hypothetical protein